jgi:hypothetical protein
MVFVLFVCRNSRVLYPYWIAMTSRIGQGGTYIREAKDATSGEIFVGVLGSPEAGNETCVVAGM